jgi:hypothetical protein
MNRFASALDRFSREGMLTLGYAPAVDVRKAALMVDVVQGRLADEERTSAALRSLNAQERAVREALGADRQRLARELLEIRSVLGTMAVLQDTGMTMVSTVDLVAMTAQDHEDLEERMNNIVVYLKTEPAGISDEVREHIQHLIRGGSNFPDSLEGLDA